MLRRSLGSRVICSLHHQFLLLFNKKLHHFQILKFRGVFLVGRHFANVDPLLNNRNDRSELAYHCLNGIPFRLFLFELAIKTINLRAIFSGLFYQIITLHVDLSRGSVGRRMKTIKRIFHIRQPSLQPGNFQLGRDQIGSQMVTIGFVDGRIKFDQYVASFDLLSIMNMDGTYHPHFKRLDDFGSPRCNDLSGRGSNNIDVAERLPTLQETEYCNDGRGDRASGRRGRRLDDFQRRR